MKKFLVLCFCVVLALVNQPMLKRAFAAACPGGSTCVAFLTYWNTFTYTITGGATARSDLNRWRDNGIDVLDAGVDCTGTSDNSTVFQALINAAPNGMTFWFPIGCRANFASTITINSLSNITFTSPTPGGQGDCSASVPEIIWTGASGGVVWDFEYANSPTISNLNFQSSTNPVGTFLNFDRNGSGGTGTGTHAVIKDDCFNNGNTPSATFNAIYIAPTTNSNEENNIVNGIHVTCSNVYAGVRSHVAVISTSTALTSADAAFVSGDAGKVIWISYAGYFQKTTIASVTNSTTIVLTAPTTANESGVTIHTGSSLGNGIHIGPSQNAIQNLFWNVNTHGCDIGIWIENGGADIQHLNGGYGDYGVKIDNTVQTTAVTFYECEENLRGIENLNGVGLYVANTRMSNDNQLGDGFVKFGAPTTFINGFNQFTVAANSVLIGVEPNHNPTFISIGNNFSTGGTTLTWTQIGYGLFSLAGTPVTTIADILDQSTGSSTNFGTFSNVSGAYPAVTITGNFGHEFGTSLGIVANNFYSDGAKVMAPMNLKNLPTSCTGLATGTIWNNSNVLNVCP